MGTGRKLPRRALLVSAAAVSALAGQAAAQENTAGDVVSNTFTLDYTVGGTAQTQVTNAGAPTTFTVDRKVDLNVTSVSGSTGIAPGQTDVPLIYAVNNEGNDTFQFILTATDNATNGNGSGGTSDNFDTTAASITWYTPATGTTACSSTAGDYTQTASTTADVASGGRVCVRVLRNVPATATDAQQAGLYLNAQAAYPSAWAGTTNTGTLGTTGDAVVAETGANAVNGGAQNVFLDGDGPNDGDNDGIDSDQGFIVVSSAPLTASKSVFALATDGSGGCAVPSTLPTTQAAGEFFVPGACVLYVIEADNSGGSNAAGIAISDVIPDAVTYAASTVTGDLTNTTLAQSASCTTAPTSGPVNCTVSVTGGELLAGNSGALVIAATVD